MPECFGKLCNEKSSSRYVFLKVWSHFKWPRPSHNIVARGTHLAAIFLWFIRCLIVLTFFLLLKFVFLICFCFLSFRLLSFLRFHFDMNRWEDRHAIPGGDVFIEKKSFRFVCASEGSSSLFEEVYVFLLWFWTFNSPSSRMGGVSSFLFTKFIDGTDWPFVVPQTTNTIPTPSPSSKQTKWAQAD